MASCLFDHYLLFMDTTRKIIIFFAASLAWLIFLLAAYFPFAASAAGETYATLSGSYCHSDYTIVSSNQTAEKIATSYWHSCGSDMAKSSGKWYFEAVVNNISQGFIGVAADDVMNNYVGETANSYGYFSADGSIRLNGSTIATGATYSVTDNIAVAWDADNGSLFFYKNNVEQAEIMSVSGSFRPMTSLSNDDNNVTFNFGSTTFAYSAPSGFNAGWYTGGGGGTTTTPLNTNTALERFFEEYYNTLVGVSVSFLGLALLAGLWRGFVRPVTNTVKTRFKI